MVGEPDRISLNKAHYPVTALGPGRRIGLWLQGCALACPGCVSRDTWAFAEDQSLPLSVLLLWCQQVAPTGLDGITISGGEPFAQPEALLALLEALHDWRTSSTDQAQGCGPDAPSETVPASRRALMASAE